MEYIDIKDPQNLVKYCRKDDEATKNLIFKRFFELFYQQFKSIFNTYCDVNSSIYKVDDQLETAFNHGLCIFYNDLRQKGWNECGASVRAALFTYCYNQLRALTKSLRKHSFKLAAGDPDIIIDLKSEALSFHYLTTVEEKEIKDYEIAIFENAFKKLDQRCRDLIHWRKLREITDDEIKAKYSDLNIESRGATDAVFRCVSGLKKIVAILKGEK